MAYRYILAGLCTPLWKSISYKALINDESTTTVAISTFMLLFFLRRKEKPSSYNKEVPITLLKIDFLTFCSLSLSKLWFSLMKSEKLHLAANAHFCSRQYLILFLLQTDFSIRSKFCM